MSQPVEVIDPSLSRNELINWINDLLRLNLTRIEQLGTGAVHCQLLDVIYPGKIPLHKVNWRAKFEYEFVYNFKILQQSFTKFNIPRYIDVEKLIKAKYQDNLEFAQWMKRYFQSNCTNYKDYDPVSRRGNIEPDFAFVDKISIKSTILKEPVSSAQVSTSVTKSTPSIIVKAKSSVIPAQKGITINTNINNKNDGINSAGINGIFNLSKQTSSSNSNTDSTTNLLVPNTNINNINSGNTNQINNIQSNNSIINHINMSHNNNNNSVNKDNDVYTLQDLNKIIDKYKLYIYDNHCNNPNEKNTQLDALKTERDFYYNKLRDIDYVLDIYKDMNNLQGFINTIKEIIYMLPEKVAIICDDGNVIIKNKNEDNLNNITTTNSINSSMNSLASINNQDNDNHNNGIIIDNNNNTQNTNRSSYNDNNTSIGNSPSENNMQIEDDSLLILNR